MIPRMFRFLSLLAFICAGISSLHAHLSYSGRDFGSFCACCETNSNNLIVTIPTNKVTSDHGWADAATPRFGDSHHLRAFRFKLESEALAQITIRGRAFSTNPALQYPAFSIYSGLGHLSPDGADYDTAPISTNYMNMTYGAGNWDGCFNPLGTWVMGNLSNAITPQNTNGVPSLTTFTYVGHAADGTSSNFGTNPMIQGDGVADGTVTGVFKLPIGDYTIMVGDANFSGTNATNTYGFDATLEIADVPLRPTEPGVVLAWGDNSGGQCTVPAGLTNVVQVAAGDLHSVALLANGQVVAWGDNALGQCDVPAGLTNAVQVVAGNGFTAALNDLGQVIVWGDNTYGQTNVPSNCCFSRVAAGEFHLLALKANGGNVIAWGDNTYGQTNVPTNCCFLNIAAGDSHSMALGTNGRILSWGDNTFGQTNVPVGLSTNPRSIAAHGYRNIAINMNGTAVIWGGGPRRGGQPVPPGFTNLLSADAGWYHYAALRANRSAIATGDNTYGQTDVPVGATNLIQISAGGFHTLALKSVKKGQTLAFGGMVSHHGISTATINLVYGTPVNLVSAKLAATASSGLPVTYTSQNPAVVSVSTNGILTPMGVGSTTITASQGGNGTFNQAESVTRPVIVGQGTPIITFRPAGTQRFAANATFTLSATASGNLPVTYSSGNTNVISVSGSTATIKAKGKTTLAASVTGDANWRSNSVGFAVTVK